MDKILTDRVVGISELKRNPMKVINDCEDEPIAVLRRGKPVCYLMSVHAFEVLDDYVGNLEDIATAVARGGQGEVKVKLEDL